MRFRPSHLILYMIAGLVSSAMAGIFGLFLTAVALAGPGAFLALIFAPHAALIGIKWTGATAVFLGTILSTLGESRPRLRRRWIWAATGIAAALIHFFLPWPEIVDSTARAPDLREPFWVLPLIFTLSGAGAALAFRATIRLGRLFLTDDDEP